MRWLLGNFADPQYRLSGAEQRRVTRLAHEQYLPPAQLWTWTAALVVGLWGFAAVTIPLLLKLLRHWNVPWAGILGVTVPCVAAVVFAAWVYRFLYRRPVRRAMRDLGYDVCLGCGYRLEGLGEGIGACPECGDARGE